MVKHNSDSVRFEASVNGGLAFLQYGRQGDRFLLVHVQVPPSARGRGIASELTRTALQFTRDNGLEAVPICSFVSAYMGSHPEMSTF